MDSVPWKRKETEREKEFDLKNRVELVKRTQWRKKRKEREREMGESVLGRREKREKPSYGFFI